MPTFSTCFFLLVLKTLSCCFYHSVSFRVALLFPLTTSVVEKALSRSLTQAQHSPLGNEGNIGATDSQHNSHYYASLFCPFGTFWQFCAHGDCCRALQDHFFVLRNLGMKSEVLKSLVFYLRQPQLT